MEKEMKDQVIFVKDLLFAALYQWRKIIIAAVIFAVALGGFGAITEWKSVTTPISDEEKQTIMDSYEYNKKLLEEKVENAQQMVKNQEEYKLESAIMALDPYSIYRATIELTVLTDKELQHEAADNTSAILYAYEAYLGSDQVVSFIAEEMELKAKYLTELIAMKNGGSATKSLSITVTYPDAEGAQQIKGLFLAALDDAKQQITQNLGAHNSSVVASGVNERIDLSIIDRQNEATTRLTSLNTALEESKAQLDALTEPNFRTNISVKKVIILAILGGILGAGLVACFAWVSHIAGGKVYSARVLKNKTDIRILGCAPVSQNKNPIDRWLCELEGRSLGEDSLAVAIATTRNYCTCEQSVLILGDCEKNDLELVAQELTKLGVQAQVCGSLLRDPVALEMLPKCDSVLLVERCGCSNYANILLTQERIADQNKPLIGCVLLEG